MFTEVRDLLSGAARARLSELEAMPSPDRRRADERKRLAGLVAAQAAAGLASVASFADPYFVGEDGQPLSVPTADLWFMDLRRTGVVLLGEAGCPDHEIAAISGHQIETVKRILETYLPRTRRMAEAAIERLEAWRQRRDQTQV